VIQLANRCRDTAEQNGHQQISRADLDEALLQFSAWKLQNLADGYAVNYPFLARLFPLFEESGYLLLRPTLHKRLVPTLESLKDIYPEYVDNLNVVSVIDTLYGIGFLGVQRSDGVA
jgi:hypothetical protein